MPSFDTDNMMPKGTHPYTTGQSGFVDDLGFDEDSEAMTAPVREDVHGVLSAGRDPEQYRALAQDLRSQARRLDSLIPPERRSPYHYRTTALALRTADMADDAAQRMEGQSDE